MVSLHPETTEKHVLFSVGTVCDLYQHAASVSWWLSSGRWNVAAWHFVQQSCSSFWFSQGYCLEAAETLSCLFHCMWLSTFSSSACNVKGTRCLYQGQTRAQPLPNCLCDILKNPWVMCNQYQNWSQPYAGSTPFATVDPVCRPTCHVAGESPWITVIQCQCHPRWRSHKSPPVLLFAESRFQLGGSVEHVWDEMECWFRHLHQQPSEANKLATAY